MVVFSLPRHPLMIHLWEMVLEQAEDAQARHVHLQRHLQVVQLEQSRHVQAIKTQRAATDSGWIFSASLLHWAQVFQMQQKIWTTHGQSQPRSKTALVAPSEANVSIRLRPVVQISRTTQGLTFSLPGLSKIVP